MDKDSIVFFPFLIILALVIIFAYKIEKEDAIRISQLKEKCIQLHSIEDCNKLYSDNK